MISNLETFQIESKTGVGMIPIGFSTIVKIWLVKAYNWSLLMIYPLKINKDYSIHIVKGFTKHTMKYALDKEISKRL